jgi:hypothetical protein
MKNFNNIYKLLLVLPLIFMVSCDDSDDIVDVFTNTTTTAENTVFIETDDTSAMELTVVGPNEATSIIVGVNNALDTDTTVSFSVSKDGGAAVLGTDYSISDATIFADAMTGTGSITFLTDGKFEVMAASSSNASLVVVQNKAIFLVPSPTPVTVTLTWADAGYDLDIEFDVMTETWNWSGTTLTGSYGYTNSESMTASLINGNFAIWINEWAFTGDVDYTMEVETVNGTETFTGTVTQDSWVLWFTLDRDIEGAPIFTFFEDDPS